MSEDTQSRLKAFLERNKTRISGLPNSNEKPTSNTKPQEPLQNFNSNQTNKLINDSFSNPDTKSFDNRIPTESSQQRMNTAKDFDGVSFEYQPVSLFAVMGNGSYADERGFGRSDNVFQTQSSEDESMRHNSPELDPEANFNSNPFMTHSSYGNERSAGNNTQNNVFKKEEKIESSKEKVVVNKERTKEKSQERKVENKEIGVARNQGEVYYKPEKDVSEKFSKKRNDSGSENPSVSYATPETLKNTNHIRSNKQEPFRNDIQSGYKSSEGRKSPEVNVSEISFESKEEKQSTQTVQSVKENKIKDVKNVANKESEGKIEPVTKKVKETENKKPSPQKNKEEKSKENIENSIGHNSSDLYSESSKKLNELNDSTPIDSGFKKEIKNLMKVIRQEKDQVVKDIKTMADDLNKYKKAYKQLQRQEKAKNELKTSTGSPKKDENSSNKARALDIKENNQTPNAKDKTSSEEEKIRSGAKGKGNPEQEVTNDFRLSTAERVRFSSTYIPSPDQELNKDSVTQFIINDMNLDHKIFYKEPVESSEEDSYKPTINDLISSQRDIIHFLVKRYQIAEHDRLKTEENISNMMSSMDAAITQLEKKETYSRSSLSPSPVNSAKKKSSIHY